MNHTHYDSKCRIGLAGNHKEVLGKKRSNSQAISSVYSDEIRCVFPKICGIVRCNWYKAYSWAGLFTILLERTADHSYFDTECSNMNAQDRFWMTQSMSRLEAIPKLLKKK